jgi:hypothetical protein
MELCVVFSNCKSNSWFSRLQKMVNKPEKYLDEMFQYICCLPRHVKAEFVIADSVENTV